MTRKAIVELIIKRCKDVDSSGQFQFQYVEGYCDQVWKDAVIGMALSNVNDLAFYSKIYEATDVSQDSGSGYYYSDLPETIINIPRIGSGVASIKTTNSFDNFFAPLSETDFGYILSQEAYRSGEDVFYFVGYNRVWYGGSLTTDIASTGVDMRLVIPFSKYDLDEELPVPTVRDISFVDAVVQRIIGTPPTNTINKNE